MYIVNSTIFSIFSTKREGLVCSVGREKLVGCGGVGAGHLFPQGSDTVASLSLRGSQSGTEKTHPFMIPTEYFNSTRAIDYFYFFACE